MPSAEKCPGTRGTISVGMCSSRAISAAWSGPAPPNASSAKSRGFDPRDFALLAFGGAGPLHAAEIARELHIPTLIVPRVPGHFSALGMLLADLRHDYVRTYYKPLTASDFAEIDRVFDEMIADGRRLLIEEGTIPE